MSDIVWDGDAMEYACEHVRRGVLRVEEDGSVWRHRWWSGHRWSNVAPRRAENVGGKGYLRVSLGIPGGKLAIVMAHNLVYRTLVGPIPEGLELDHKNMVKKDNRPSNLEPVTQAVNVQRSYANGRKKPWTDTTRWRGKDRVSADTQAAIVAARRNGDLLRDIAKRFGISISHTHRIIQEAA